MSDKVRIRTSKWDLVEESHEPIEAKQECIQENIQVQNKIHELIEAKQENIQLQNKGALSSDWNSSNFTDVEIPNVRNEDRGDPDASSSGFQHPKSSSGQSISDHQSKDACVIPGAGDGETGKQNNSKAEAYNKESGGPHGSMSLDMVSKTREHEDQNASKLQNSQWSDVNDGRRDKPSGRTSNWHRTEDEHNDIKDAAGWNDIKDAAGWTVSVPQSYPASNPSGHTEWTQHSHDISPRGRYDRQYRSRSRSRSWSRSWSRSRSRSRSQSPISDFRKEPDGWGFRGRPLSGRPEAHCRDFAAGRCQRGAQCRYLHEDGDQRKSNRFDDSRDNKYERSRTSVSGRKDYIAEPMERRDYVFDKTSRGLRNNYDEGMRNRSIQHCFDFKMGRCQRGSACRYLHHDLSYREKHVKGGYSERTYFREGDRSSGNDQSHEYHRLKDIPCKFFAVGNCKNGNKCRFSHLNPVSVQNPTGGKSVDDKVAQVWEDQGQQPWNDSPCNDQDPEGKSNIPIWIGDNKPTQHLNPGSVDVQIKHATYLPSLDSWQPEQMKYSTSEMSPLTVFPVQVNPQGTSVPHQPLDSTVPSEISAGGVPVMLHQDNKEKNMLEADASTIKDNRLRINDNSADKQSAGSLSRGQSFMQTGITQQPNIQSYSPVRQVQPCVPPVFTSSSNQHFSYSLAPTGQEHPTVSQASSSAGVIDFNGHAPNVFQSFYSGHNMQNVYSLPSGGPTQTISLQPNLNSQGPNGNQNVALTYGQSQYASMQPPPGASAHFASLQPNLKVQRPNGNESFTPLPANGQSQYANVQPTVNLDANKQGSQLPSSETNQCVTLKLNSVIQTPEGGDKQQALLQLPHQSWPDKERQTVISDTSALKNFDSSLSESSSGNKVVTSEQIAQLSNLSASLAQIFGNSQQLPQLYASLNPVDSSGRTPAATNQPSSMVPVSAVTSVLQSHMNSSGDNGKPEMMNVEYNNPDGYLSKLGAKMKNIQDSMVPLQTAAMNSTTEGHSNLADSKNINLEGKLKNTTSTPDSKLFARNERKEPCEIKAKLSGESQKPEQSAQTEEAVADDVTDGDEKRSKDDKAIRLFKNALVEFVKDILKPAWREGNMSKEAHKTIVKKVVEKVTSVMQSNIPQTQDKVDLYLSYSKAKLTKLVQAYVEKYSKL